MYAALVEKRRRHLVLRSLLTERGFRSQAALTKELERRAGIEVHRTTVGEDLRGVGATYRRFADDPLPSWHIPFEVEQRRQQRDASALDEVLAEAGVSAHASGDEYVLVATAPGESRRVGEAILAGEFGLEDVAFAGPVRDDLVLVQIGAVYSTGSPGRALRVAARLDRACGAAKAAMLSVAG